MKFVKLRDVFGVGRDLPLNYIERETVDKAFVESLTRDKHVVIYGSSKQGKTTLRKHCLRDSDSIVISCLNTMSLTGLNGAILKAAGYRIEQTQTKTTSGAWKYGVEFVGEGSIPLIAKGSGKVAINKETQEKTDITSKQLEIDLSDVNDIIAALKIINFSKFIILEDFHYLPVDTQRDFSFSLKSFHENSNLCFIVIGVWREKNRLIYYNGDLTNRISSIDVDTWNKDQLSSVITLGEKLLNIEIYEKTKKELLRLSSDSVAIIQEACFKICEIENIGETQQQLRIVGARCDVQKLVKDIVDNQAGRYQAFITNFSEGFQQTELEMYKWLVYAILSSSIKDLEDGIRRSQISTLIKNKHPEGKNLNEGNITQALQNTASLQVQKNIRPIIFDYDQTTRVLAVVDLSFLKWLEHQNVSELVSELGITESA